MDRQEQRNPENGELPINYNRRKEETNNHEDPNRHEALNSRMQLMSMDSTASSEDDNRADFQHDDHLTDEDDEDVLAHHDGSNSSMAIIDRVMGVLEDIVIEPSFQTLYNTILDTNYYKFKFDNANMNDEDYMNFNIFMHYSCTVGSYLENELKKRLNDRNFDMEEFISKIRRRPDLMDHEIIEMIFTLLDYTKFQELITEYTTMKADGGKLSNLIASGITVTMLEHPEK